MKYFITKIVCLCSQIYMNRTPLNDGVLRRTHRVVHCTVRAQVRTPKPTLTGDEEDRKTAVDRTERQTPTQLLGRLRQRAETHRVQMQTCRRADGHSTTSGAKF